MTTKEKLIEEKQKYEELLLSAIEIHHKLPPKLQKLYDEMIKEYIEELKKLNKRILEMT